MSDTFGASMALHGRGTVSRAAQLHRLRCVFDTSSPEDLSLPSQNLGKACAHSFCMTFLNRGRQAVLPSTFGIMTSARIVSPCFTRPRFELGLSSRAPQVSAKRVRLSCFLKSRVLSSIHHDVLDIDLSTQHLSSSPSHSQRFVSSTTRS